MKLIFSLLPLFLSGCSSVSVVEDYQHPLAKSNAKDLEEAISTEKQFNSFRKEQNRVLPSEDRAHFKWYFLWI